MRLSTKSIVAGLGVLVIVGVAKGAVAFARDFPRVTAVVGSTLVLFVALACRADRRRARMMSRAESVLAGLDCPKCSARYDRNAAFAAFHPLRKEELDDLIVDDFGHSNVKCSVCGAIALFHRSSHELILLDSKVEIPHPSQDSVLVAVLQFGGSSAAAQTSLMADYRSECEQRGASPHVSEPNVEIVEAIQREAAHFAHNVSGVARELAGDVVAAANTLLQRQPALVDGSGFFSDEAKALRFACDRLLRHLDPSTGAILSIFELMCEVCD